jgi:hypothetical protein
MIFEGRKDNSTISTLLALPDLPSRCGGIEMN